MKKSLIICGIFMLPAWLVGCSSSNDDSTKQHKALCKAESIAEKIATNAFVQQHSLVVTPKAVFYLDTKAKLHALAKDGSSDKVMFDASSNAHLQGLFFDGTLLFFSVVETDAKETTHFFQMTPDLNATATEVRAIEQTNEDVDADGQFVAIDSANFYASLYSLASHNYRIFRVPLNKDMPITLLYEKDNVDANEVHVQLAGSVLNVTGYYYDDIGNQKAGAPFYLRLPTADASKASLTEDALCKNRYSHAVFTDERVYCGDDNALSQSPLTNLNMTVAWTSNDISETAPFAIADKALAFSATYGHNEPKPEVGIQLFNVADNSVRTLTCIDGSQLKYFLSETGAMDESYVYFTEDTLNDDSSSEINIYRVKR